MLRRRRRGGGSDSLPDLERLIRFQAALGAVAMNMIQPFVAVLAIRLGATNPQLGSLSALPNLLSIPALLAGGWLLSRRAQKAGAVASAILVARLLWLLVAAVPWATGGVQVSALILAWGLALAPHNVAVTGMGALVADLFPQERRAGILAAREAAATAAGVAAGLVGGLLLDRLPFPMGYQLLFVGAALVGVGEALTVWQVGSAPAEGTAAASPPRPPSPQGSMTTPARAWYQALCYPPFLRFTAASVLFHFSWQMVWPLFSRFHVSELGATNTWISLFGLVSAVTAVLTAPHWAGAARRYGQRRTLILAASLLALLPALTAAAPNLYWLLPVNLVAGLVMSGVVPLVLGTLLEVAPAPHRPLFMAINSALVAASATVAPVVGGLMMELLPIRPALWLGGLVRLLLGVGAWVVLEQAERAARMRGGRQGDGTAP